uniref:Uncharacterized protein n=1 Tax=Gasterosteus aculeatus TaxID=69293 RepID=G3Q4W2_GASAC
LEEQFKCCICLDIFTHPTSIPCGHNFCLECIEGFWDTKRKTECPLCKEKFRERPPLKINCGFNEIIKIYKRILFKPKGLKSTHLCGKHRKPLTKFCTSDQKPVCVKCTEREHKHHTIVPIEKERNRVKKTKRFHCVNEQKITEREIQGSAKVCSLLITAIEKNQARLVEELEQKHQEAERRAAELLQELQQEIRELQRKYNSKGLKIMIKCVDLALMPPAIENEPMMKGILLKGVATTQHSKFPKIRGTSTGFFKNKPPQSSRPELCLLPKLKHCAKVSTETILSSLFLEANISNFKHGFLKVDRLNQYAAVDVTLDPETASGWLVLSPDRKKVAVGSQKNNLVLDSPRRFNSCVCVSGKQSFATGRRYWVVQVGNKTDWDLGVARESINRKGAIAVRPDSGYWAICRRKGAGLNACAGPSVKLCLKETPQKVGVFLDYDEGLVSFYDAEAKTHIYTYSGCDFNEPLNPYFNPCVPDEGKNIAPLIICPVEESVH